MIAKTRGKRGRSNQVDAHVGTRVRMRRTLLGYSQEKLGDALGLTFQQVQKYERGANRIGASRLWHLSRILDVPVAFFFEDMEEPQAGTPQGIAIGLAEGADTFDHDPMAKRETLELVRSYYKISDPKVRRRVFELVKALGKSGRGG
jgi:transcriptional regulator with XRE-family HTH domain